MYQKQIGDVTHHRPSWVDLFGAGYAAIVFIIIGFGYLLLLPFLMAYAFYDEHWG